jgi:hypothetical protein
MILSSDIVVGRLQQLQDDVLDILADIARFGQRGRVGHRERHIEDARQRLRQQRLARSGRTDQQDVRLRQFDVVVLGLVVEPLVVIVDRDRQHLLGVILADHIIIENLADFLRRGNAVARLDQRGFVLLADDVHAEFDAFVADEDRRSRDQLADFVLAFSTERTVERVLGIAAADLRHSSLRIKSRERPALTILTPDGRPKRGTLGTVPPETPPPSPSLCDTLAKHASGTTIKNPLTITAPWSSSPAPCASIREPCRADPPRWRC